jgi:hypothetical protein
VPWIDLPCRLLDRPQRLCQEIASDLKKTDVLISQAAVEGGCQMACEQRQHGERAGAIAMWVDWLVELAGALERPLQSGGGD